MKLGFGPKQRYTTEGLSKEKQGRCDISRKLTWQARTQGVGGMKKQLTEDRGSGTRGWNPKGSRGKEGDSLEPSSLACGTQRKVGGSRERGFKQRTAGEEAPSHQDSRLSRGGGQDGRAQDPGHPRPPPSRGHGTVHCLSLVSSPVK